MMTINLSLSECPEISKENIHGMQKGVLDFSNNLYGSQTWPHGAVTCPLTNLVNS